MSKIIIHKSLHLNGEIFIGTSKNAVLPIIAAAILTDDDVIINHTPKLSDVSYMLKILRGFGARAKYEKGTLIINCKNIDNCEGLLNSVKRLRASFLFMGPMLAKRGCVRLPMPGGCKIGLRPINLHIKGLKALGAEISTQNGWVQAKTNGLTGAEVYLNYPSVGATENTLMAAVLADGVTTIKNAASEPEIADLADFLISMGANIRGAGTNVIRIKGVKALAGTQYTPIPDRIEVGTMMMVAAMTQGDITLKRARLNQLSPLASKLMEAGAEIFPYDDSIKIRCKKALNAQNITSSPYPGFPTDLQALYMALASTMKGTSVIVETVFENRFMQAVELIKMGADINVEGQTAVVNGKSTLNGAKVKATDLRAGAALILAGLNARDKTVIEGIEHIDRGYERIEVKLKSVGADIKRV